MDPRTATAERQLQLLYELGDQLAARVDAVLAFYGDNVLLGDLGPSLKALETSARRWRSQSAHARIETSDAVLARLTRLREESAALRDERAQRDGGAA